MPTSPAAEPLSRRHRLRRTSARTWIAVLGLTAVGVHGALPDAVKYGVELVLLVPVLVALGCHPGVIATLGGLSRRLRGFVLAWVALLVVGNVLKQHRITFPFMGWGMFGRSVAAEPRMVRSTAIRRDGSTFGLVPGGVVSDVAASALDGRLAPLVRAVVEAPDHDARAQAELALVRALQGVARMHEDGGGEPPGPIAAILVEDCRTGLTPPYERRCRPVGTYAVERGR
jgi:hypothetical protein